MENFVLNHIDTDGIKFILNPSTVISTVVPRDTPSGATSRTVGGVMREPVG